MIKGNLKMVHLWKKRLPSRTRGKLYWVAAWATLGVRTATGARVGTAIVAVAVADWTTLAVELTVTLATIVYEPGKRRALLRARLTDEAFPKRSVTELGSNDGDDQTILAGEPRVKHEAIVVAREKVKMLLTKDEVMDAATIVPVQLLETGTETIATQ